MGTSLITRGATRGLVEGEKEQFRRKTLAGEEGRAEKRISLLESQEDRLTQAGELAQQKQDFLQSKATAQAEGKSILEYAKVITAGGTPEAAESAAKAISPDFNSDDIQISEGTTSLFVGSGDQRAKITGPSALIMALPDAMAKTGNLRVIQEYMKSLQSSGAIRQVKIEASPEKKTGGSGAGKFIDSTKTINGKKVAGQTNTITGRFHPFAGQGGGAEKAGKAFLLPDNETTVLSFDGGRTFKGEDGKTHPMPPGALPLNVTISGDELNALKAQQQVSEELETTTTPPATDPIEAAKAGTGPRASVAAAFDAVAGGLGLDTLIGKEGLFKNTQDSRQFLRTVKQEVSSALRSSRPSVWDQKRIDKLVPDPDKFFTNPRTEARKFKVMDKALRREVEFNKKAIKKATSAKEINKLREANTSMERILNSISPEQQGQGQDNVPEVSTKAEFDALPKGTVFIDTQDGKKYKK